MIVISNTSPLTSLAAIGLFEILRQLYKELYIPRQFGMNSTPRGNAGPALMKSRQPTGYNGIRCRIRHGKDIVARKDHRELWVTVKGYPMGTARTRATTQASHWFKRIIFDPIAYRSEDPHVDIAVALPDFKQYRDLAQKVVWLEPLARFSFFWVREDGFVEAHLP